MKRIHIHWTAGGYTFNSTDAKHYHFGIDGKGNVHPGNHKPEANLTTSDGVYAAHTRRANTGAIGVALCGMSGAKERPFSAGAYAITAKQVDALVDLVADLAETYGIPIERTTVLTHAEVETTLGVAQRGKWDITWLPGMDKPGDPIAVGDMLRARIRAAATKPVDPPRTSPTQSTTIRAGAAGAVSVLTGAGTAIAQLDGTAQIVVIVCAFIALAGLAWIVRERLKRWARGDR